jgi:soluble lytic murein transglycosylase-like protein
MRRVLVAVVFAVAAALVGPAGPSAAGPGIDALMSRGVAAYLAGAPAHALAAFVDAARLAPASALPALWAGVAAVAAGRIRDAETWFRASLARPHSTQEARVAVAWLDRLGVLRAPAPLASGASEQIAALAHAANPRLTAGQARWVGQAVVAAAQREGLDPWLLASVIYVESRFNHQSVSWAGAMGLGQLMPGTAAAAGVDPRDPWGNVLGAAEVLRWNYLAFRSWPLALAAYNAGADAVRRYGGVPPYAETQWYVSAVIYVYQQLASRRASVVESHSFFQ